jgi:tRNA (guanine-N7-)-methyltransferase
LAKNKLKKFAQMETFKNVKQPSLTSLKEGFPLKGKWNKDFFKNDAPIVLELGCGMGEYTVGLAEKFPNKNFLGIDVKGARMWQGASIALDKKLNNVGFLRISIEWIEECFSNNEVSEVWITFPDPQIKKRRSSKRLTHPGFLKKYSTILVDEGVLHLKTDSEFLYGFTLGVISAEHHRLLDATNDLYSSLQKRDHMEIKTHYEQKFLELGKPITYIKFKLNDAKNC